MALLVVWQAKASGLFSRFHEHLTFLWFCWFVPDKKHHVKRTPDERDVLQAIARKKNAAAIKVQKTGALPSGE